MDTRDNAQPDRDQPIGGTPREAEPVDSVDPPQLPELHRTLRAIADEIAAAPCGDLLPQVMARATRIRRRRRAARASSAVAVLVLAAVLGPSVASELGVVRGGDAAAAPPPRAIVDLTSAYPVPSVVEGTSEPAAPAAPENALTWPSRGATVPAQAVTVAKSYLVRQKAPAGSAPAATATVAPLWAQVDVDTAGRQSWLYVMQGWTTGADGSPSPAELLVGDYTQARKESSMSVYAAPITFAHARPGSSDDSDDARQIAELSVWLPRSGRLVVLGAPQTATVLYARTGGDLIPQRTTDGVAVFPRTRRLVKGRYADMIQVRDARNVALTPPKAWSAADFQLSGPGSLWSSGSGAWVTIPAPGEGRLAPVGEPSAVPEKGSGVEPTVVEPTGAH